MTTIASTKTKKLSSSFLEDLVTSGRIVATGETRTRRFSLKPGVSGHGDDDGQ